MLSESPVLVKRNQLSAGDQKWTGDNLATYFVWPQKDPALLVGVIAGTGVKGMKAAYANQYFAGGSGFPDLSSTFPEMMVCAQAYTCGIRRSIPINAFFIR